MTILPQEPQFHFKRNCGCPEVVVGVMVGSGVIGDGVGEKEIDDVGLGEIVTMGVVVGTGVVVGVGVGTGDGVGAKQEPTLSPWSRWAFKAEAPIVMVSRALMFPGG